MILEDKYRFAVSHRDAGSAARVGELFTPDGFVSTPAFMPVGTVGAVKTLTPDEIRRTGSTIVLANTYHLSHHPGVATLAKFGGMANFMAWRGPTYTDSGGFQVFSLSDTRKVDDGGVEFRSVYNGQSLRFTPESVLRLQQRIGANFIVALDECPPYPAARKVVERATDLTSQWARAFMSVWRKTDGERDVYQAPFLVVQGGLYEDLRAGSMNELAQLEPFGFGIGGLSVGEPPGSMLPVAEYCCRELPEEKPRHLMGVGTPKDIAGSIDVGVDLFDCVLPTRNGRNGQAFTSAGVVNIRNLRHARSEAPLDGKCGCYACKTFSRAYLHHLFMINESLGKRMLSLHNITYYQSMLCEARQAIIYDRFTDWKDQVGDEWSQEERS